MATAALRLRLLTPSPAWRSPRSWIRCSVLLPLLHGHGLGQVAGPVDVVAVRLCEPVGKELQGHRVDDRGEHRLHGGYPQHVVGQSSRLVVAVVADQDDSRPRLLTSWMLEHSFS